MIREHSVLTVLGYSRVITCNDAHWKLFEGLYAVLGRFEKISFQVLRLSEEFFEVTVRREGVDGKRGMPIVDTVAGKIGDQMRLSSGETLVVENGGAIGSQIELKFWSNK
jgi:hypothetical protein